MSDRINVIADFDETNTGYIWTRPDTGEDATQVVPATAREYVLAGGTATIPLRASDDPDLSHSIRHWIQEHIDGAANPVRYAITVLRTGGSPQYLSVLRAAALATPPPAPTTNYVQSIASDDNTIEVTRSGGAVNLRAVGGGAALGTALPLAGATPAVAGTAEAASHEDHQHPAIPLAVVTARSMAEDETPTDGLLRAVDPDLQIRMDDPGNVPPMTVVTLTLRAALAAIWSVLHGLGTSATRDVGTTAGTVAAGDDSRITGAATAANLTSEISTRAADDAALAGLISDEAIARANTDSAHAALTTTAHGGIVANTDSRLSDSRMPTTHASSHATGGSDAVTPTAIGAEPALGNPGVSGYLLSSTTGGVRSWTAPPASSDSRLTGTGSLALGANAGTLAGTGTLALLESAQTFTGAQTIRPTDTATATVLDSLTLGHASSGVPAAGFGTGLLVTAHNASNAVANVVRLAAQWATATAGSESSDLLVQLRNAGAALATVLKIAGTGGFQAQTTNSGGVQPNALGTNSVDWQTNRDAATRTASGAQATVGGGMANTASGAQATVAGGRANAASSTSAAIGGGYNNNASNAQATVAGGEQNTASGDHSTIAGGGGNIASSTHATVGGGWFNTASTSTGATVAGGDTNTASGSYSGVLSGLYGVASLYGQQAQANGRFSTSGDAQRSVLVARIATTDATATELFLDGTSARLTLATNRAFAYSLMVMVRNQTSGNTAAWKAEGVLSRGTGSVALSGNSVTALVNPDVLTFTVAADTTNQSLKLAATGLAANTIHWVARIDLVEVI